MSGLSTRILWTGIVYLFVVISCVLLSIPRFDMVSVVFIVVVIAISSVFAWRITKHTSLLPYVHGVFKEEAIKVLLACVMVLATRYAVFYITGGIWEKASMIVLTFMLIAYVDRNKLIDYGITIHYIGRQLSWAFISIFSVWCIRALVSMLIPIFIGVSVVSFTINLPQINEVSIVTITLFLAGNFAEEIFFRGYMQTKLKRFGLARAILIQAFAFALYHLNYLIAFSGSPLSFAGYIFFTFLFGIFMGLLFELSGSIIVTTVVHAGMNILFGYLYLSPISVLSDGSYYIPAFSYSITTTIIIVISLIMLIISKRRKA